MTKIICIVDFSKQVEYGKMYYTDDDFVNPGFKPGSRFYVLDYEFPEYEIGKYPIEFFITLAKWRDKQIEDILS